MESKKMIDGVMNNIRVSTKQYLESQIPDSESERREEAMDYLQHMYGPVNFTIVDQVDKLPYKVSEIYRRITV